MEVKKIYMSYSIIGISERERLDTLQRAYEEVSNICATLNIEPHVTSDIYEAQLIYYCDRLEDSSCEIHRMIAKVYGIEELRRSHV